jgi:hypothetical protein
MKESYLQEKIRELNYKIKQQMDLAEQLNQELQRLQQELKQHKHLIEQLKAFETYKETTIREINHETKKSLAETLNKTHKDLNKELHATLKTYIDKHKSQQIPDLTPQFKLLNKQLEELTKSSNYTKNLLDLLIDQLITDRQLAHEQADIIKKRAQIRGNK